MFTGIIKEVVKVTAFSKKSSLSVIAVSSKKLASEAEVSDSMAINGVCLTLTKKSKNDLFFEAVASTLANTNLKRLKVGDLVNLEPALKAGDKLGGHFVLGHVDTELKLRRIIKKGDYWQVEIDLPSRFKSKVLENGSIAVEGISLTVKKIYPKYFTLDIIPFTYRDTTLQDKKPGAQLNVEFDYLLKQNKN
ncbi:MAG: riboflavin synthase [Candidatus Omnitrophica bacterium]|nr:riboflavin synthase [Candidatus Omnitrophota bacterium]